MAKILKYPVGTRVLTSPNDCWEKKIPAGTVVAVFPRYRIVRWDRAGSEYSPKVEAILLGKIIPDNPKIRELAAKYARLYKELDDVNEAAHKKIQTNRKAFRTELTRVLKALRQKGGE